jgi:pheromone shutdown protein TraB
MDFILLEYVSKPEMANSVSHVLTANSAGNFEIAMCFSHFLIYNTILSAILKWLALSDILKHLTVFAPLELLTVLLLSGWLRGLAILKLLCKQFLNG